MSDGKVRPAVTAAEQTWERMVSAIMTGQGKTRAQAIRQAAIDYPAAHEAYLKAYNERVQGNA